MEKETNAKTFSNLLTAHKKKLEELKGLQGILNTAVEDKNKILDTFRVYNDTNGRHRAEPPLHVNINKPFVVSDDLIVYNLNPFKSKRVYKKHRLSKSPLSFSLYTCEIIENNFIVTLDNGIVFCGDTIFEDLYKLIPGFDFQNIHSFFGLTDRMVQAAFYVNHN